MSRGEERGQAPSAPGETPEHHGRLERDGVEAVGGEAHVPAFGVTGGHDRDAGGESAECAAKAARVIGTVLGCHGHSGARALEPFQPLDDPLVEAGVKPLVSPPWSAVEVERICDPAGVVALIGELLLSLLECAREIERRHDAQKKRTGVVEAAVRPLRP